MEVGVGATAYGPRNEPAAVQQARELAAATGFERSCEPEVGRVLQLLAAACGATAIGEIGSGCGVGTAWLASGAAAESRIETVELDGARAAAVADLLADDPRVRVHTGDWRLLLERGPFSLLFVDVADAKAQLPEVLLPALAPGGVALFDDLTPLELWPPEWHGRPDPVRTNWLRFPDVHAVELPVTATASVVLAVRRHLR